MDLDDSNSSTAPSLIALDPPKPPTDLVQSALFLPLSQVGQEHKGRKIRTIGQVLSFDAKRGILLLSAISNRALGALPTLLVNVSNPLLGMTPAMPDVTGPEGTMYSNVSLTTAPSGSGTRSRREQLLRLERGEFVTVVGWMEGEGLKLANRIEGTSDYLRPSPIMMEAIHIANSRPPSLGNDCYRGATVHWPPD